MVWYCLTERDLNINKIRNVDRVILFLTNLHNFNNHCTSLRFVTAAAVVFTTKVNLITRKSVVIVVTRAVINVCRLLWKVPVIFV